MKSGFFKVEPGEPSPDPEAKIIKSTAKPLPAFDPKAAENYVADPEKNIQPALAAPGAAKYTLSIGGNSQKALDNFKTVFERELNMPLEYKRMESGGVKKIELYVPIHFDASELEKTGIRDMAGIDIFPIEGWFVPKDTLAKQFDGLDVDNPEHVKKRLQEHAPLKNVEVHYDHYADRGLVLVTGMEPGTKRQDIFTPELTESVVLGEAQQQAIIIPESTLVPFGALRLSAQRTP